MELQYRKALIPIDRHSDDLPVALVDHDFAAQPVLRFAEPVSLIQVASGQTGFHRRRLITGKAEFNERPSGQHAIDERERVQWHPRHIPLPRSSVSKYAPLVSPIADSPATAVFKTGY